MSRFAPRVAASVLVLLVAVTTTGNAQKGTPQTDREPDYRVQVLANGIEEFSARVRVARAGAKQGDVFTPAIRQEFKKVLIIEMSAGTWASIMDDNPGDFSHQITGTYEKGRPVSTVPPNILALLPTLPAGIQYRYLP